MGKEFKAIFELDVARGFARSDEGASDEVLGISYKQKLDRRRKKCTNTQNGISEAIAKEVLMSGLENPAVGGSEHVAPGMATPPIMEVINEQIFRVFEISKEIKYIIEEKYKNKEVTIINIDHAEKIYRNRRRVDEIFREYGICDGPAWDIILDLYVQTAHRRPVSVTSAAIAASCPATTALRWLHLLQESGLIVKRGDPLDQRRTFLGLTPLAEELVEKILVIYSR